MTVCAVCGERFEAFSERRRYCGETCKKRAYRRRKRSTVHDVYTVTNYRK